MITIFVTGYLFILSFYDWREKAVPAFLLWAGGGALVIQQSVCLLFRETAWQQYFIGLIPAMAPGALLTVLAVFTKKAGTADGIVFFLLGILLGYQKCILLFALSLVFAALFSGGMLLLHRGNRHTEIPYLPFVTAAYMAGSWMWR